MVTDRGSHFCIYCGMNVLVPCESSAEASDCVNREPDIFARIQPTIVARETYLTEPQEDKVNKPSHYTKWAIEPVSYIMRNGMEFWRGNIIKYATRAGSKTYDGMDAVESEITDLEKVRRYAEMRINMLRGETVL